MPSMMKAGAVLDRDFLEMRHRVLDLAAALDRMDRGQEAPAVQDDPRLAMLHQAIRVLTDGKGNRAERVQLVFSIPYDENWQGWA